MSNFDFGYSDIFECFQIEFLNFSCYNSSAGLFLISFFKNYIRY